MPKYFKTHLREYIFIILTATIFSQIYLSKSFSEENVFVVNKIQVKGVVDINFSRDKFINVAFSESFKILTTRILLSRDLDKLSDVKLDKIKSLINSFQILKESYRNDQYEATFKVYYSENKIKKLLETENISFSQPRNILAIFYPAVFIEDEMQHFSENFFYKNWNEIKNKNELINFILPLEDIDDLSRINKMKDKIEQINFDEFVNKYNLKNYVFSLMTYENKKLKVHLKTNFNDNKLSKNLIYELDNINNEKKLTYILKDIKMEITDIWKEENIINLSIPLLIRVKFEHKNIENLDKIKEIISKINIVDNFSLEELSIKDSIFKINYYGNPKKLKAELSKFGYELKNDQGNWAIYYK